MTRHVLMMERPLAPNPNRFDISKYTASHRRNPRGIGLWVFAFHYCDGAVVSFCSAEMFSVAKANVIRQSRAKFGARAWQTIYVMP